MTASAPRLGVTLFSFTREYYLRRWSFSDCLARVGELEGAQSLEIIGAQFLRGYPHATADAEREFRTAADRHHLTPAVYDAYLESGRRAGVRAGVEETVGHIEHELTIAARLGFPMLRLNTATPAVLCALLPAAERAGIRIVVELHGQPIRTQAMQELLELFERLDNPHLGFLQDLGAMAARLPRRAIDQGRRMGCSTAVLDAVEDSFNTGDESRDVLERVRALGGDEVALGWARAVLGMLVRTAPDTLHEVLPHLAHVHAKFVGIDDGRNEPAIPYAEIMSILRHGGYDGIISSEYAGFLYTDACDAFDQVQAHQRMVQRMWLEG